MGNFPRSQKIVWKQGGNLKRGKCIIASGGMDTPADEHIHVISKPKVIETLCLFKKLNVKSPVHSCSTVSKQEPSFLCILPAYLLFQFPPPVISHHPFTTSVTVIWKPMQLVIKRFSRRKLKST